MGTSISEGILERFYSFQYRLTSINGKVGNGGLNVSETWKV